VRTISQGKGSQLLLGSTRNSILQGTFELNFQVTQQDMYVEYRPLGGHCGSAAK
jgi:hypothetical protein